MAPIRRPVAVTLIAAVALAAAVVSAGPAHAADTHTVAVYYVGHTGQRPALYREWRTLAQTRTPIRQAVNAMLNLDARDPDYHSLWADDTRIRGISRRDNVIKVDLSREARFGGSARRPFACTTLQQLVWTVTAVDRSVTRVQLLIEGSATGAQSNFWGVNCAPDTPMARKRHYDILAPVQISRPNHGRTVQPSFTFGGDATVFEATVSWSVVDLATGRVIRRGFDTATTGAPGRGRWSASVTLPASYSGRNLELRAWEASGEDGGVTKLDDKVVKVA